MSSVMPFRHIPRKRRHFRGEGPADTFTVPPDPSPIDFMASPLFPVFADLRGRTVLVVGGGGVSQRKVAALLEAGAAVRVGAPDLTEALERMAHEGRIEYLAGRF